VGFNDVAAAEIGHLAREAPGELIFVGDGDDEILNQTVDVTLDVGTSRRRRHNGRKLQCVI
jgi:hypothetical protein